MSTEGIDVGDEYEVEKILSSRMRRGKRYYLVRWKGFDESENSWEPESNLVHCRDLVKEFKIENTPAKGRLTRVSNRRESEESYVSTVSENSAITNQPETAKITLDINHKSNQIQKQIKETIPLRQIKETTPLKQIKGSMILLPGQFKQAYGRYPEINEVKENVRRRSLAKFKGEVTPELKVDHKAIIEEEDPTKYEQRKFLLIYMVVAIIALGLIFYLTDAFQLLVAFDKSPEENS